MSKSKTQPVVPQPGEIAHFRRTARGVRRYADMKLHKAHLSIELMGMKQESTSDTPYPEQHFLDLIGKFGQAKVKLTIDGKKFFRGTMAEALQKFLLK